jgi:hypothetical protein
VRRELAQRKLQCPFPFGAHAHDDLFGALLERLQLDGRWPDRYDKVDRNRANKQARLDTAMWAVQHAQKFQLAREQIQAVAKSEPGSDDDAWRIVADQHGLLITVVQVLPRSKDSFSVDWTVGSTRYEPTVAPPSDSSPEEETVLSDTSAPVEMCVVYSVGKYWSTAAIASMRTALDDDWMPQSLRAAQAPRATSSGLPQENPATAPKPSAAGGAAPARGPLLAEQASWPPPVARKSLDVADLHVRDNITAIGRSKRAGTTWQLSKAVERAFNPQLLVEERERRAAGRLAEARKVGRTVATQPRCASARFAMCPPLSLNATPHGWILPLNRNP